MTNAKRFTMVYDLVVVTLLAQVATTDIPLHIWILYCVEGCVIPLSLCKLSPCVEVHLTEAHDLHKIAYLPLDRGGRDEVTT